SSIIRRDFHRGPCRFNESVTQVMVAGRNQPAVKRFCSAPSRLERGIDQTAVATEFLRRGKTLYGVNLQSHERRQNLAYSRKAFQDGDVGIGLECLFNPFFRLPDM